MATAFVVSHSDAIRERGSIHRIRKTSPTLTICQMLVAEASLFDLALSLHVLHGSSMVASGVNILFTELCTVLRVSSKIRLIYEGSSTPVGPEYPSVARQTSSCFAMRAMLTEFLIGIVTEYEDAAATMTVSLLFGPER